MSLLSNGLTDDHAKLCKALIAATIVIWALAFIAEPANAATGGGEFQKLYELIAGWAQGYLGRAIAVAFVIVGLLTGLVRGSVIGAVTAIGAAVALLMLPTIIDAIFTGSVGG